MLESLVAKLGPEQGGGDVRPTEAPPPADAPQSQAMQQAAHRALSPQSEALFTGAEHAVSFAPPASAAAAPAAPVYFSPAGAAEARAAYAQYYGHQDGSAGYK